MKKRHYHVLSGMHGYLPDRNEAYRYKSVALEDLAWWVKDCRAAGLKFNGSLKEGYFECTNPKFGVEYIELVECYEEDCLEDEDE